MKQQNVIEYAQELPAAKEELATLPLLERARRLRPLLEEYAFASEAAGELAAPVVDALRNDGFFGVLVPKCVGGSELAPTQLIAVTEELSWSDGSTAWVTFAAGFSTGMAGAYLEDSGLARIFGNGIPWIAGSGHPTGLAEKVEGGYRLTGHWNYGSGIKHARYIHTGALLSRNGAPELDAAGSPTVLVMIVPVEEASLEGNWDVLGLRATGSIDYSIKNVFVPDDAVHLPFPPTPRRGGDIYRVGSFTFALAGHAGFSLGVGRRALDALAHVGQTKTGMTGKLGASESFQEEFARSEARLRAARAFAYESWGSIETAALRGDEVTTRHHTLTRLALNHATWTAADVCNFAYNAAGGVSLRKGIIQRCFRDMHAATQHVTSSPALARECGRELAGLAKDERWLNPWKLSVPR